jgi:hypothetical protein
MVGIQRSPIASDGCADDGGAAIGAGGFCWDIRFSKGDTHVKYDSEFR